MLNEPATRPPDRNFVPEVAATPETDEPARRHEDPRLTQIRDYVAAIFTIVAEHLPDRASVHPTPPLPGLPVPDTRSNTIETGENVAPLVLNPDSRLIVSFEGTLLIDSETAYNRLDDQLAPLNLLALFRDSPADADRPARQRIYIVEGRLNPRPRSWVLNLVLLLGTLFTVLLVGMDMALSEIAFDDRFRAAQLAQNGLTELWRGLPYALSIMLILGAHELGHYFAARRHNIAVTLPYFLPFPFSLFGTLGAFIQLRQPIRNRKVLLQIGAAGPLAGLVFAIPILLIGLATSRVEPPLAAGIVEGNSILYALAKIITFGRFLPDGNFDVYVNQLAWAGWTGLFVTGLNLIPVGQLDGGHVLYALLGKQARLFYYPMLLGLTVLVILSGGALLLLVVLLFFLGRTFAVPLDDITPLDQRHRWLALATLVIFLLVFVPIPLTASGAAAGGNLPGNSAYLPLALVAGIVIAGVQRLRR